MHTNPRRGVRLLVVVLSLGLTAACGGRPAAQLTALEGPSLGPAPQVTTTSPPPRPMPKKPRPRPKPGTGRHVSQPASGARLAKAASAVEPDTTLGAVVYDRTTGRVRLAYNAEVPFRSASLVKLLIAIDVLDRGAGADERARIARMLKMSDDNLASKFWVEDGGPELVLRTAAELGLTGVRTPEDPGKWGQVVLTPQAVVTIYRYVLNLPSADRSLIVDALAQAPRYAEDGFDQYFGIPDGLAAQWAVKQGWGSNGSSKVLHSTGLVGPGFRYIVVLLTDHPLATDWPTASQSLTAAAAAVHDVLPEV
jgi:hypothetical protein